MRRILTLYLIALSLLDLSCGSGNSVDKSSRYMAVTKVVDGDTFWVNDGSEKGLKIRLIGVDAPESRNVFRKVVGYYGKESKQFMTTLLTGKKVRLEYDVDRLDMYRRTLAYVYLQDGTFINAELVRKGYGMVMTVPPNVRYAEKFVKLERRARNRARGLWNRKVL
ncbi:MAG: thermonuclease family protein [Bacteroidota bacterium]